MVHGRQPCPTVFSTAMATLQDAVRPDTPGLLVSVTRGRDGASTLLRWKDFEGVEKDIDIQEVMSRAAEHASRAPSRVLASHLLTNLLTPELFPANL